MPIAARAQVDSAAWLLFVPAAASPHKIKPVATDAQRLAMLGLALRGTPDAEVWDDEIIRPAPSFTIDTLRRLREAPPGLSRLSLLIGADQAVNFHHWREPREILALATPLVLPRQSWKDGRTLQAAMGKVGFWTSEELARWEAAMLPIPVSPLNATQLRDSIRDHGLDAVLPGWLHPDVAAYIRAHGIYSQ